MFTHLIMRIPCHQYLTNSNNSLKDIIKHIKAIIYCIIHGNTTSFQPLLISIQTVIQQPLNTYFTYLNSIKTY